MQDIEELMFPKITNHAIKNKIARVLANARNLYSKYTFMMKGLVIFYCPNNMYCLCRKIFPLQVYQMSKFLNQT